MADITNQIIGAESGGNPYARNSKSSAGGAGQFIDGTWLSTLKKHRPDIAAGKSDADLLRLKFDPSLSREMTSAYASDNQGFLKAKGIAPTPGNTYLAHFAGPSGAAALYANPAASVEATLGSAAVRANPFLQGKNGQDVINWAAGKMDPSKMMAANLRKRFGTATEGGVVVPAAGAAPGTDRLKAAIGKYDPDLISAGQDMQKRGQAIAVSGDRTGAIGGTIVSGLGGLLEGYEGAAKKEHDASLGDALMGSKSAKDTIGALMGSSDPEYRKAGIEMLVKSQATKPEKWVPAADGRGVVNEATGEFRLTGIDKAVSQTDVEKRAIAAGLKPGTPEFNAYVLQGPEKQASKGNPISNAATLRKEFDDLSKDYRIQIAGSDRVRVGAKTDSPQGDMALVYGFMKMLDPGSVVREGEFATAEQTAGLPDRIAIAYQKMKNGERLTPDMRAAFVKQAEEQLKTSTMRQDALVKRYSDISGRADIDPRDIVTTYPQSVDPDAPPPADPNAPAAVKTQTIDPATGQPMADASAAPKIPSQQSVAKLLQEPTPEMQQFFDMKYGQGAAQRALETQKAQQPTPAELMQSYGAGLY